MSQPSQNAAIAQQIWDAVARGDAESFNALCVPGVVWRRVGDNPLAGKATGTTAVLDLLARVGEAVDDVTIEMTDVFASEHEAGVTYKAHWRRGSRSLVGDYRIEMVFDDDALLVEAKSIALDSASNDAFWREVAPRE